MGKESRSPRKTPHELLNPSPKLAERWLDGRLGTADEGGTEQGQEAREHACPRTKEGAEDRVASPCWTLSELVFPQGKGTGMTGRPSTASGAECHFLVLKLKQG